MTLQMKSRSNSSRCRVQDRVESLSILFFKDMKTLKPVRLALVFRIIEDRQRRPFCAPCGPGLSSLPFKFQMSDSYCRFLEQKLWAIIPGRILVFSFSLPYLFLLGQCGYYMALTRTNSCRNPKRRTVYLLNCITRYLSWRLLN